LQFATGAAHPHNHLQGCNPFGASFDNYFSISDGYQRQESIIEFQVAREIRRDFDLDSFREEFPQAVGVKRINACIPDKVKDSCIITRTDSSLG
jgi:hypothetical protein